MDKEKITLEDIEGDSHIPGEKYITSKKEKKQKRQKPKTPHPNTAGGITLA